MRAIIVGASKPCGIGFACAQLLSSRGYEIVLLSRSPPPPSSLQHLWLHCDLSLIANGTQDAAALLRQVERHWGAAPTVFVNTAAISSDGLLAGASKASLIQTIQVNVSGTLLLAREVVRCMLRGKRGGASKEIANKNVNISREVTESSREVTESSREVTESSGEVTRATGVSEGAVREVTGAAIVHVGSVVGLDGNAGQVAYAASKAALVGMNKSLAKEVAARGIRCNLVAPGFVDTDMTAHLDNVKREAIRHKIPLQRFAHPEVTLKYHVFDHLELFFLSNLVLIVFIGSCAAYLFSGQPGSELYYRPDFSY